MAFLRSLGPRQASGQDSGTRPRCGGGAKMALSEVFSLLCFSSPSTSLPVGATPSTPRNGVQEEAPPILIFVSSLPLRMAVSLPPCFLVVSHLALLLHAGNGPTLFFGCLSGEDHVYYSIWVQHTTLPLPW